MKPVIESLRRFLEHMAGRPSGDSPFTTAMMDRERGGNPLTRIHQTAEDTTAIIARLFGDARLLEGRVAEIQEQLGLAWQVQSELTNDYYALLRAVLLILDDCRTLGPERADVAGLTLRLEKVLREQRVEIIPTAEGDPFDADQHCCEKTESTAERPPGTVLSTLAAGYLRRLKSGLTVIVRPARVVVSQSPGESEEQKR